MTVVEVSSEEAFLKIELADGNGKLYDLKPHNHYEVSFNTKNEKGDGFKPRIWAVEITSTLYNCCLLHRRYFPVDDSPKRGG